MCPLTKLFPVWMCTGSPDKIPTFPLFREGVALEYIFLHSLGICNKCYLTVYRKASSLRWQAFVIVSAIKGLRPESICSDSLLSVYGVEYTVF